MTPIQFAAHQTAHGAYRGHLAEMAAYLGIGEQILRNKVNPEQEQARLSLDEAVRMMKKDGDLRILEAVAAEFGRSISGPQAKAESLVMATLNAAAECADVSRAVTDTMKDRRLTQAELAKDLQEIQQAHIALDVLKQTLIAEAEKQNS